MKSNIKQIIDFVAANNGLSKKAAEAAVRDVFDFIKDEVASGREIAITDFGAFKPVTRAARTGRNPATGETIQIAAKTVVSFKPAKSLRDEVKEGA